MGPAMFEHGMNHDWQRDRMNELHERRAALGMNWEDKGSAARKRRNECNNEDKKEAGNE